MSKVKRLVIASSLLSLGLASQLLASGDLYFLCGTDEDGCSPDHYEACLCIPHDGDLANQPYCLNFTNVSCVSLDQLPECNPSDIFKNQAICLAVAFQSEDKPLCHIVEKSFCVEHGVALCEQDGGMQSCR